MASRDHGARNAASRARLQATCARLGRTELAAPAGEGVWTVGQTLAHLAFWDRFMARRWQAALASGLGQPPSLPEGLPDLLNDALSPSWRLLGDGEPAALAREVLAAAEAIDMLIAGIADASLDAVPDLVSRTVDRSFHRSEHLDQIDAALA